uniref:Uncharacterized protein n=1 Tax=Anguilla anguilla TaxID=7936 RepID=A0A0E9SIB3_ANGAN
MGHAVHAIATVGVDYFAIKPQDTSELIRIHCSVGTQNGVIT